MDVFFGGAGWLFAFNFGVAQFIREERRPVDVACGLSAGSVTALLLLLDVDFQEAFDFVFERRERVKNNPFKMKSVLRDVLEAFAPDGPDFRERTEGRLRVLVSRASACCRLTPGLVDRFACRDECVACVEASCHIPVVCGVSGVRIGRESFFDGGLTWRGPPRGSETSSTMVVALSDAGVRQPGERVVTPGVALPRMWVYFPQTKETMQALFDLGYHKARARLAATRDPTLDAVVDRLTKRLEAAKAAWTREWRARCVLLGWLVAIWLVLCL